MSNLNKVMLIGRLGQEPEIRHTQSGQMVANFSLATNDYWKDKQGQKQEKTEWHNIVVWGNQADFVQNYVHKGRLVYVEGRLQTRSWEDKTGAKRYTTEVVANTIQLLDRQGDSQGQGHSPSQGQGQGQGQGGAYRESGPPPQQQSYNEQNQQPPGNEPYMEDDIPF
ncbi:MAG: single-stranded DNA-binding protein [Deltaproteobacteria bacterium]|nr:single-stranded DNA-binding protein [Deltaproteobacteria bacterium]